MSFTVTKVTKKPGTAPTLSDGELKVLSKLERDSFFIYENPCVRCGVVPEPHFPLTWAFIVRVGDDDRLIEDETYVVRYKHLSMFRTEMYEDDAPVKNVRWIS